MYRCAFAKLPPRAQRASRSLYTASNAQLVSGTQRTCLASARKPLALVLRTSLQTRSYAIAAEDSNKGVVRQP